MALNPHRDALGQSGLRASRSESPFKAEADAALDGFRAFSRDLRNRVGAGDLTPKVARTQAAEAAGRFREELIGRSENFSAAPRAFADRLAEAAVVRKRARDNMSLESLQRETNRLLRQNLVEQQLTTRVPEFEARAFVRPIHGGRPAPTLQSLIAFHESALHAGDDTAMEWSRRQLEMFRTRVVDPDEQRRIDRACDRPDQVNPRIVGSYLDAMRDRDAAELEAFVAHAIEGRDANACMAAYLLARQAPEGPALRWVRSTLNGLNDFPDAALSSLRAWEAEARVEEAEAARAHAEYAVEVALAEARFPGLEAPTAAELEQQARLMSRPVASAGEPIGLAVDRRGLTAEEYDAMLSETDPS